MRTKLFSVILHILALLLPGQAQGFHWNFGEPPHIRPVSHILQTNLSTTTNPQSAPKAGAVFLEDTKMVDVTIYVSSQAELYEALQKATGGETILLAPGQYGDLSFGLYTDTPCKYLEKVTITSADPENPASLSGLSLNSVINISFDTLIFDYKFDAGDVLYTSPFLITNSKNVSFQNSVFDGDIAHGIGEPHDGYGFGKGLFIRSSDNVVIENSEFFNWHKAIVVSDSDFLRISGNDIHGIRSDGIVASQVSGIQILENYIHDFIASDQSLDHQDFIQFFTSGTSSASNNITISGNILEMGDGSLTQFIFMRNELVDTGKSGLEMFYQDVLIENNVLLGSHVHGITVGETDGLVIGKNTVLAIADASMTPSIRINGDSLNVEVYQNAVSKISGYSGQDTWFLYNNAFIQNTDPNSVGYYGDVFLESSMTDRSGVSGYIVAPGSLVDLLGAGAVRLYPTASESPVRAVFDVTVDPNSDGALILDGRFSFGPDGSALPSETIYAWKLANGDRFDGPVLRLESLSPGYHVVELTIVTPSGATSNAQSIIAVSGPDILAFDSDSGSFVQSQYGATSLVDDSNISSMMLLNGRYAIDIGGSLSQTVIDKALLERFFGAESFSISFDLQADQIGTNGQLFGLHTSFLALVNASGDLQFTASNDEGTVTKLVTSGAGLNDGGLHNVVIDFAGTDGFLSISVDGQMLATSPVSGTSNFMGSWPLVFGGSWGAKAFDGKILAFDLDVTNNDYPFFSGDLAAVVADVVPIESEPSPQIDPVEENVVAALPELSGYKLNLAGLSEGTEGKLVGDAYVGLGSGVMGLVLDGANDGARIGTLHDYDTSSVLAVELAFARTGLDTNSQVLVSNNSRVTVSLVGDSITVSIGGAASKDASASFSAVDLGITDFATHTLRIIADDFSDQVQMFIDGALVVDRSDLDFTFDTASTAKNWWSKGWSIGEGTRRDGDFEGIITDFQIDDSALFFDL